MMQQPGLQWCKMPGCKRACRLEQSIRTGYCQGCRLRTAPHHDERDVCPDPDAERDVKPEPQQESMSMSMGGDLRDDLMKRARDAMSRLSAEDRDATARLFLGHDGSGHPEFHRILDEMRALHVKKAADYGLGADVLANCRGSTEFGIPAHVGVTMRMNDKMTRLKAFAQKGSLQNESVEDSLLDIACYAIIALILYREAGK